jgi:PAS domain S-box-containing protein
MRPIFHTANHRVVFDALLASGAEAARLRESAEDAKIFTDTAGRIQHMNQAAEQLIGVCFERTRGRPLNTRGLPCTEFFNLVEEAHHQSLNHLITQCIATDEVITLGNSAALVKVDGEHVPIGGSIAPMRVEGFGTIGVIMTFRDATATRHLMGRVFDSDVNPTAR